VRGKKGDVGEMKDVEGESQGGKRVVEEESTRVVGQKRTREEEGGVEARGVVNKRVKEMREVRVEQPMPLARACKSF